MPLSPSAAWTAAFTRGNQAPRFLVAITNGATTWKATNGRCSQISEPPSILAVSDISAEMDPLTREITTGGLDIMCEDAWLRPIMVANRLSQQEVTVTLGAETLAEGDFIAYFKGIIDSFEVEPNKQGITLRCLDAFGMLKTRKIVGYWFNLHPLLIIKDILDRAEIPTDLYDSTSLDPSQAVYTAAISHYTMSRGAHYTFGGEFAVREPTPAWDLVQEICELLNGQFVADESGVLKFILFDNSAATDFAWTSVDYIETRPRDVHSQIVNRYEIEFNRYEAAAVTQVGGTQIWVENDTDSQSNYAHPDETERIMGEKLVTPWLDQQCQLMKSIDSSETSIAVGGTLHAFCGLSWNGLTPGPSNQPSWAALSAARKIYFRIENEVITATGISTYPSGTTLGTDSPANIRILSPDDGTYEDNAHIKWVTFTGCSRGALGTTAAAHTGVDAGSSNTASGVTTRVYDVTIPYWTASNRIKRFGDGIHILECENHLWTYAAQLGDMGTVVDDTFVAYGMDGTDTSDKWEIIGKSLDQEAGKVTFTLASAGTNSPTTTNSWRPAKTKGNGELIADMSDRLGSGALGSVFVPSAGGGFGFSSSGLAVTVAEGRLDCGMTVRQALGSTTFTVPASKDSYFFADAETGAVSVQTVTTGSSPPSHGSREVPLGMVAAGAAAISSTKIDGIRPIKTAGVVVHNTEKDNTGNLGINGSFSMATKR